MLLSESKKHQKSSQQKRLNKVATKPSKSFSPSHPFRKINDKQITIHVVTWTEAENVIKQSRKDPFISHTQLKEIITSGPFFIYSKNKPSSLYASVNNDKEYSARLSGAACHKRIVETKRYTDAKINFSLSVNKSLCQKFVVSFVLSNYETNLSTSTDRVRMLENIRLDKYNDAQSLERFFKIANATNSARELANTRATEANPGFMEDKIEQLLNTYQGDNQIRLEVICGEEDLVKTGLNLIWSVGRGANDSQETYPRLIVVEYLGNPHNPKQKIAFVGKGITYDTGGLHLKLHHGMDTMYNDKGGACAVFGALKGTIDLDLSVNAIFAFPLAQNAIGPNAIKPSDIVTSYSGKTVQITNTDAEGRLVMADAMSFVQNEYQGVTKLVDIATLTGAIKVALGQDTAGLFTNSFPFSKKVKKLGHLMFEQFWQMPITAEHRKDMQNQMSDLKNWAQGAGGGACRAAAFLQEFVKEGVQWCHLDVAGPAFRSSKKGPLCAHATAFGTQTLINILIQEEGEIDLLD